MNPRSCCPNLFRQPPFLFQSSERHLVSSLLFHIGMRRFGCRNLGITILLLAKTPNRNSDIPFSSEDRTRLRHPTYPAILRAPPNLHTLIPTHLVGQAHHRAVVRSKTYANTEAIVATSQGVLLGAAEYSLEYSFTPNLTHLSTLPLTLALPPPFI